MVYVCEMFRIFHFEAMESLWSSESDAVGPNFSILTVGVNTNAHLTNN